MGHDVSMRDLGPGLYDQLIDQAILHRVDRLAAERLQADLQSVDPAELADRVGEVLGTWVRDALASVSTDDRADAAMALSRAVLTVINGTHPEAVTTERALDEPLRRLAAVERLAPTDEPIHIGRPLTPLRDTVLMTNARDQPRVGSEIEAEIASADRIDLVLAFIRWTGIRPLLPHLRRHVEAGRELRIITTTYTGSTELRALEALTELGAQVKVSYDTTTTRLHAKAWLFQRASGFSTVYIGSSNLTFSAQVDGLAVDSDGLRRQLCNAARSDSPPRLSIRADRLTPHHFVVSVMDMAMGCGIAGLNIVHKR